MAKKTMTKKEMKERMAETYAHLYKTFCETNDKEKAQRFCIKFEEARVIAIRLRLLTVEELNEIEDQISSQVYKA